MSEQWRTSLLWRKDEPDVGQWVEVQHKGICQYLGPSDITDHKYIDRNGTTHSIGNYGWRPLPATHEERRLRELLRWRDAETENPESSGRYLVATDGSTDIFEHIAYYSPLIGWSTKDAGIGWWRPIGPLPSKGGE